MRCPHRVFDGALRDPTPLTQQDHHQMTGRGCTLSLKYPMRVLTQLVPPTRSIPPLEAGKTMFLVCNSAGEQTPLGVIPPMGAPLGAYAGTGVCPPFRQMHPRRGYAPFPLARPLLVPRHSRINGPHLIRAIARRRFAKTRILALGRTHHHNRRSSPCNPRPPRTARLRRGR